MNIYLVIISDQAIDYRLFAYTNECRAIQRAKKFVEQYSKEAHEQAVEENISGFLYCASWRSYDYVYVKEIELIH